MTFIANRILTTCGLLALAWGVTLPHDPASGEATLKESGTRTALRLLSRSQAGPAAVAQAAMSHQSADPRHQQDRRQCERHPTIDFALLARCRTKPSVRGRPDH